jgi:hypothetical protein
MESGGSTFPRERGKSAGLILPIQMRIREHRFTGRKPGQFGGYFPQVILGSSLSPRASFLKGGYMAWYYELRGSRNDLVFYGAGYRTKEKAKKAAQFVKKMFTRKRGITVQTALSKPR